MRRIQVIAWGYNAHGQTNVPPGLGRVVAVSGGQNHSVALKEDGTVAAWGDNGSGQTSMPADLSNVVAIAAGNAHTVALKADGTVVSWGSESAGDPRLTNIISIAAGYHSLGIIAGEGAAPLILRQPMGQSAYWGKGATLQVSASGWPPVTYLWLKDNLPLLWATNESLVLTNLEMTDAGAYTVIVSNYVGSVTSSPALLIVNPAGISLGLYPGITIDGAIGKTFDIQFSTNVSESTSWTTVTSLTLTTLVQLWIDTNADATLPTNPRRFYRVVPMP